MLKTLSSKAKLWAYQNIYYDKAGDKPTVFLAGSARSGTTWISNLIRAGSNYRTLFEPFHFKNSAYGKVFLPNEYIHPSGGKSEQVKALESVMNGRVGGVWENQDNRCLFPDKRLIKDIHSNLRLSWIQQYFPDLCLIYLIRHPLDVAQSRMRLGWNGKGVIHSISSQDALIEDFPEIKTALRYLDYSQNDRLLPSIFLWCVQQKVALSQLQNSSDCAVFAYEDFIVQPQQTTARLYQRIGLSIDLFNEKNFQKRSRTSQERGSLEEGAEGLSGDAIRLLKIFDLDSLYNLEGKPNRDFASLLDYFS